MSWYEKLDVWTADYLPDMAYEKDVPLRRYTSFRIGGAARRMAFPRSGEELVLLVSRALELGARPFVLGNGTNVLFPDEGVERLVISTREIWLFLHKKRDFPALSSPTGYRAAWAAA